MEKTGRRLIVIVIILSISTIVPITIISLHFRNTFFHNSSIGKITSYILIEKDTDFEKYKYQGAGTKSDPYLLTQLEIDTNKKCGIAILDTTAYFIIANCNINAVHTGIFISNIASGSCRILNNTLTTGNAKIWLNFYCGIYVAGIDNITIEDNFCYNSYYYDWYRYGLCVMDSSNIFVRNNTCEDSASGIAVRDSTNCEVINNTVIDNYHGIIIFGSTNILLSENKCYLNEMNGIFIHFSSSILITQNVIKKNGEYGIYVYKSSNTKITNNELQHEKYNVYLEESSTSLIHHNNFYKIESYFILVSLAYSDHQNNSWFDLLASEGNYWSDLSWDDGIVYQIAGPGKNNDSFPLQEPAELW